MQSVSEIKPTIKASFQDIETKRIFTLDEIDELKSEASLSSGECRQSVMLQDFWDVFQQI
jgi:hypothetical protein